MRHWIKLKLLIPNMSSRVLNQHKEIYEAIRTRDAEAARNAMRKHLDDTARLVTQVVQQRSSQRS